MRKHQSFFFHIFVFVLAQLAWLSLLGLWIYRYFYNIMVLNELEDVLPKHILSRAPDYVLLVGGCILFVAVSIGMSLIFRYLSMHLKMNKMYDNFIANITHELKSPIASIQLYLQTLDIRDVSKEKQQQFIHMMLKDTNRLQNLVHSILEISGLEHKQLAYNCDIYPTDKLVKSLILDAKDQFNLKDDEVIIQGECPYQCVVDKGALKIAFDNLLNNAIKYSNGDLVITISLSFTDKSVIIKFSDNGIGISRLNQKKIFKKFFRIYSPDSPSVKGTGLGLYWVKEIVKYHGGKIDVQSEGRDKGTCFIIEFPIYQVSKKRYLNYLLKIAKRQKQQRKDDRN